MFEVMTFLNCGCCWDAGLNRKEVKAEMGAIGGVHEKEREGSNKN